MRALMSALLLAFQALPPALPAAGSLEVEARGGQVTVRANRVPLNRILDRLAQQTGMKVSYDSSPPSQPVTTTLERLAPRDAVVRLMEGLGVPYAFRTDLSGRRVDTLIVSDSGTSTAQAGSSGATMGADNLEYAAEVVEDVATYEEPPEIQPVPGAEPPPQIPPGMPAPDLALPGFGAQRGQPQQPYPGAPSYPSPVSNPFPN